MDTRFGQIVAIAFGWVREDSVPQLIMYTQELDMIVYQWDKLSGMFTPYQFVHPKDGGMCTHPLNDEIEPVSMDFAIEMVKDLCSYDSNPFEEDFLGRLLRMLDNGDPTLN